MLFVPRWAFWLVMQPVRLTAWAYDHYNLPARFWGALFNYDLTYGVYPVVKIDIDYGFMAGARFVHYNLLGKQEHLRLRADFGGEYRQGFGLEMSSGERFGDRFTAWLELRYDRRPRERFFGIGNADELDMPPPDLIDPATSDAAVSARFRESLVRVKPTVDAKLVGPLSVRVAGAFASREFANDPGDPDAIANSYDTSRLIGFESGVDNIYVEGELVYDSRRPTSQFQSQALDATGWYAAAHVGGAFGVGDDPTSYTRYGAEVQRFFDLYRGSRVLWLRLFVDGISGSDGRTDGKISFIDLPRLGSSEYLRGFATGRFRDRTVTLATAEYTWDLGNFLAGYLFVDAGRAQPDLELGSLSDFHIGFGGGVQVHSYRSFLMRAQLAYSNDGGVFVELSWSPAFERRERVGRY